MFFLSGDDIMKKAALNGFVSANRTHTLVIFRDEKEIPDFKAGVNLFAPGYECSFGFDPALDMLSGSASVGEAARAFSEAFVTDGDMLSARDPIWSYNARGLLSSLYICGVALWEYIHTHEGEEAGKSFPSLTDTIFGMLDDLASARIRTGDGTGRTALNFPSWWNIVPDAEQEFLKVTVLAAPLSTAGSLLAVVNSYTGNITRLYSGDKCPLLFNPDWPENVYVYLPSINAQMLGILLSCARVAWGNELKVAACGVSSWGKRFLSVLGEFYGETSFGRDNFFMHGTSPAGEILSWYTGDLGWGAKSSAPALTLFRSRVEETTGSPSGLLTALPVETPERCEGGEWICQTEAGWSVEDLGREALENEYGKEGAYLSSP